jgi:hypothetical protein
VGDEGHNRPAGRPVLYKYPTIPSSICFVCRDVSLVVSCYACVLSRVPLFRDPSYNDGKEVILRPVQNNVWTYGQYVTVTGACTAPALRRRT